MNIQAVKSGMGADIKTLSELLAHATVAFTLDVHGHVNEDMRRQAADKLEKLIAQY